MKGTTGLLVYKKHSTFNIHLIDMLSFPGAYVLFFFSLFLNKLNALNAYFFIFMFFDQYLSFPLGSLSMNNSLDCGFDVRILFW